MKITRRKITPRKLPARKLPAGKLLLENYPQEITRRKITRRKLPAGKLPLRDFLQQPLHLRSPRPAAAGEVVVHKTENQNFPIVSDHIAA